jgi:hypothetical protein
MQTLSRGRASACRPSGRSRKGRQRCRGLGPASSGRWRSSRRIREAKVEKGGTSEVGDKALACFYAGDEAAACFGPGSTTTCGGGAVVSRAIEEREFGSFKQLLSVARESAGPEILGHGHPTCDAPLLHVSSFSYDARHA